MDCKCYVVIVLGVITALLLIILLPLSYADLGYYEMGFRKSTTTGSVDTSKVYYSGRYFVGVTTTFKTFRSDLYHEKFTQLSIYNKDKIEVKMTCALQYLLRDEDLVLLHDTYDLAYKPILRSTVLSAIKGAAPQYSIKEYRLNRTHVVKGLAAAASKVLGGICCRKDCTVHSCKPGCKLYSKCEKSDKGLFADLKYFHLLNVDITTEQETRFLKSVIAAEKNDTETYKQQEILTRKNIERERIILENAANEITQGAIANSTLLISKANVKAKALVSNARNKGLQIIYTTLNIKDEEHKKTLDYVRTLRDATNKHMYIGFQYMVAKP